MEKKESINKSVSLPRRTNGLLIALSTVVLTIKTSALYLRPALLNIPLRLIFSLEC